MLELLAMTTKRHRSLGNEVLIEGGGECFKRLLTAVNQFCPFLDTFASDSNCTLFIPCKAVCPCVSYMMCFLLYLAQTMIRQCRTILESLVHTERLQEWFAIKRVKTKKVKTEIRTI